MVTSRWPPIVEDVTTTDRRRIAFYSHDTQGLGHVRRNIALAGAIVAADPDTDVLLLTGAPQATALPLPPNTEVVTIPGVAKDEGGGYSAATFAMDLPALLSLRASLLTTALTAFRPDVVVVDKVARGLDGELEPALRALAGVRGHTSGQRPRLVLGLRDVLDDPATARREWRVDRTSEAIEEHYDAVWVYGDPTVHDLVAASGLPASVTRKVRHTGYLATGRDDGLVPPRDEPRRRPLRRPYVLCMVGGGQDGWETALAFARAHYPEGHTGVIVTGPYMQPSLRRRLTDIARERDDLVVRDFVTDSTTLIGRAAAVVTMGGYNTVCEVLATDVPGLVVPRVRPRQEQLVRARRLAALGALDMCHPTEASAPALGHWLAAAVNRPHTPFARQRLALDGLARIPNAIADLVPAPHLTEVAS